MKNSNENKLEKSTAIERPPTVDELLERFNVLKLIRNEDSTKDKKKDKSRKLIR